jgi:hypothetical protein
LLYPSNLGGGFWQLLFLKPRISVALHFKFAATFRANKDRSIKYDVLYLAQGFVYGITAVWADSHPAPHLEGHILRRYTI